MCFKNKWQPFTPTQEYLDVVSGLTSISKLHTFIKGFNYTGEKGDVWQTPEEFLKNEHLDCLEENTDILIRNGIKKIKDLKVGDLVLSYNYDLEKYEYKKIVNVWDKGILDGHKMILQNGHHIIATGDHRFYCRSREDYPEKYEIKRLKDINFNYWCKKQIHCVHLLPEGNIDFNKDLAYLYGIYLAEGYTDKNNSLFIAQDKKDVRKKIEQVLDNLNAPYSKSKRMVSAYYGIRNSKIKDYLIKLGTNSFNKKLPMEVLNWNNPSIKKLIEGMLDGDGTNCVKYKNNFADGCDHNALWEYSTSSEKSAKMFNIICRKIYGNCWFYKQENHQGVGNKPIYRLRFNPKGLSNKERLSGISTVTIKRLEKISNKHYYDIEVKDNHNFVLADSGVISHNCEDFARFAVDVLMRIIKLTEARFIIFSGYNKEKSDKKLKAHAICAFPYRGKTAIFSNDKFHSGFNDYIEIGHRYYPDGLKRYEVRDYQGKILEKKHKMIGTF